MEPHSDVIRGVLSVLVSNSAGKDIPLKRTKSIPPVKSPFGLRNRHIVESKEGAGS